MEIFMKECGQIIKGMVKEFITTQMERSIEETTIKAKETVLVSLTIKTETDMKVSGKMVILTDMAFIIIQLVRCTWVNTEKTKDVASEGTHTKTG
jgi:hypothetical protein